MEDRFEDINAVEEIIVFTKNGKKNINTIEQVIRAADKNPLPDKMVFDEVRKISTDKILVKNGSLEGIVNSELKFEIPLDRQTLTLTSFGFTKRFLNKVTTVGVSNVIDNEEFTDIQPYLNWLGLFKPGDIKLYHMPSAQTVDRDLDSLWFTNRLAMALKNDSVKVLFGSGRKMMFPITAKVTFINSPDSVRYFLIEEKGKKQIYDVDTGTRRFVLEFDNIEDVGYNLFLIEQKGKKGLVGLDGKQVLPVEYDAIVRSSGHILSLLKDKKFGMYDLRTKTLVKANYERNLSFFSESVLVGYKDGYYGFIKKDTSPISEFEFDEIKPWSDSSAFVKKNFRWMV
ncbi:MAG: WG repeat-containing protein, partial [Cyclobacteriaceae bacterium]